MAKHGGVYAQCVSADGEQRALITEFRTARKVPAIDIYSRMIDVDGEEFVDISTGTACDSLRYCEMPIELKAVLQFVLSWLSISFHVTTFDRTQVRQQTP